MNVAEQPDSVVSQDDDALSRRRFITQGAAGGLALAALGGVAHADSHKKAEAELFPGAVDADGHYALPPLPYAYDALEPHIDEETMRLHHDKHHAGYVKGLIKAEAGLASARAAGDFGNIEHLTQKSAFHGAGHFLHCVFWAGMSPDPGEPSDGLRAEIDRGFGSMKGFENTFFGSSKTVEGSGWGILAWSVPARKLVILQARNHQHATQWGNLPLLVIDVWEHAYYKKYSNMRGDYIKAFMNVINWAGVSARFAALHEMFS